MSSRYIYKNVSNKLKRGLYAEHPDFDLESYYKLSNQITNNRLIILIGQILYPINFIFTKTKILILIDVDNDFLTKYFNRKYFPNVDEIYYFKKDIPFSQLLTYFNTDETGCYKSDMCTWFFDYDYTDYKYFRNLTYTRHIRQIGELKNYHIIIEERKPYFVFKNYNVKVPLVTYYNYFSEWLFQNT